MHAPVIERANLALAPIVPIHSRLRDVGLVLAGSALLALSAQIEIPMWPVPVTAQTLVLFLAASVLGSSRGAAMVAVYVLEGALGLPVFAGATGGLLHVLGPTGGYLLGFWLAALLIGRLSDRSLRQSLPRTVGLMLCGNLVIYASGVLWLARFMDAGTVIATGVLPFLAGDLAKSILAAVAVARGRAPVGQRPS